MCIQNIRILLIMMVFRKEQYFSQRIDNIPVILLVKDLHHTYDKYNMDRVKRIWYLSPMRAAKVQASLRIRAVSPEPSLLAHTNSGSRGTFRQKARSLAPLNGWACAVKICHDGMLEDTNSLDGAHMFSFAWFEGIGFGMNSMSGHVIINSYFNKRRGIAQGIVSSGAGAGVFLLAPLKQYTLVEYGWRGTMLIFAGIMLHFCVCACLMRPYSTNDTSACSSVEDSEISDNSEIEVKTSHGENIFKDNKNLLAPLLKDNVDSNLKLGFSKSVNGFLTPEMNVKYKRNRTVSEYVPNEVPDDLIYISSLPNLSKSHIRKENKRSSKLCSQDFDLFKRKDILHSGSLYNLKEFRESVSTKSFIESMMLRDENANERNICDKSATDITCCASLKVLREHLCDFTVFRNKVFIPILIGAIFIQMSQFIPNTFIAEYGYSIHLDEGEISAIMSLYGKAITRVLTRIRQNTAISCMQLNRQV